MSDRPADDEISKWHKWFAVECNNAAWSLADTPDLTSDQSDALLDAAHAARLHWQVGDRLNAVRADMLLAHAHAIAGCGGLALKYARRGFDYLTSIETPDWEMAFAHAILASAGRAAGDDSLYAEHYAEAERAGAAIADDEDRRIFEASFKLIPRP